MLKKKHFYVFFRRKHFVIFSKISNDKNFRKKRKHFGKHFQEYARFLLNREWKVLRSVCSESSILIRGRSRADARFPMNLSANDLYYSTEP